MTIVSAPTLSSNAQGALYSAASSVQIPNSPSRPSILRRREGERDIPGNNLHCNRFLANSALASEEYISNIMPPLTTTSTNVTLNSISGSPASPSRVHHTVVSGGISDHLITGPDRGPDSDGSSSGSTTLSATSSPGGAGNGLGSLIGGGNLSGMVPMHLISTPSP